MVSDRTRLLWHRGNSEPRSLDSRIDDGEEITTAPLIVSIAALSDPGVDRIMFWDDSGTNIGWLATGAGLAIAGTTISCTLVGVTDGDKGDVVVSSTGTVWSFDSSVVSTFARTFLDDTSAGAVRTTLGLVIGADIQAYNANLTTYAGIAPSANVQTILGAANYAAIRSSLSLVIGANVQAWDAQLDSLAALSYVGNALKVVRIKADETGFEVATSTAGTSYIPMVDGSIPPNLMYNPDGSLVLMPYP